MISQRPEWDADWNDIQPHALNQYRGNFVITNKSLQSLHAALSNADGSLPYKETILIFC